MICDLMPDEWSDPLVCTATINVGRAKKRVYRPATGVELYGVTTILDKGEPAWAWATWIAQEAERLFALHQSGMDDVAYEPVWCGTHMEWAPTHIKPSARITEEYLRGQGRRRSQAAMDRGVVVERMLTAWNELGYIASEDVEHWVNNELSQPRPDGIAWQCSFNEVYPYAVSLRNWLAENDVEVISKYVFVLAPEMGYATVIDAWLAVGGKAYSVNLKTSATTSREHAEQIAAEVKAEYVLPHGTQQAVPLRPIMDTMIPAVLHCSESVTKLREISNIDHWYKSFCAARDRYMLSLAEMPFETVKGGSK